MDNCNFFGPHHFGTSFKYIPRDGIENCLKLRDSSGYLATVEVNHNLLPFDDCAILQVVDVHFANEFLDERNFELGIAQHIALLKVVYIEVIGQTDANLANCTGNYMLNF